MYLVYLICAAMDWDNSESGFWISGAVTIIVGIIVFVLGMKKGEIATYIFQGTAGFFLGFMILTIITATTDWKEKWALFVFSGVGAVVAILLGLKDSKNVTFYLSCYLGAYLCTRALTLFFNEERHWPSEEQIFQKNGGKLTYSNTFWLYVVVLVVLTALSFFIQSGKLQSAFQSLRK